MALLEVVDLHVGYRVFEGYLKVLNGVNFWIDEQERVGLVGETGCGKTTLVKTILRVLPIPPACVQGGSVIYKGKDILRMSPREVRGLRRREMTTIFQDPLQALNPMFTIGTQLRDILKDSQEKLDREHRTHRAILARCVSALRDTGMPDPERIMSNYPIQLSGGMRQRVCIAEALSRNVRLLLADEPTTNLDVTIQDQILRRLDQLVDQRGASVLIITHSMGVVRDLTQRLYIMYAGAMVESGKTKDVLTAPLHPYTQGLMRSVPRLTGQGISDGIPGRIPNYLDPPPGCRFHPRCAFVMPMCVEASPPFYSAEDDHLVACYMYRS